MAVRKNPFKINILIHKEERPKLHLKLLKWALSSGRFIVILVEIIVISAFVARYKYDADLANLQEKIEEQIPYIQSLKTDEEEIRQTQFKMQTIKQAKVSHPQFTKIIMKISQLTPQSIQLSSINIDRTKNFPQIDFSISGQTPSNLELSAYLQALKKDTAFANIALTNISFDQQTTFTISGNTFATGGNP